MRCHVHKTWYEHVFMGRGVTRYECARCLKAKGLVIGRDRLTVNARYSTAIVAPIKEIAPVGKSQLMAGR